MQGEAIVLVPGGWDADGACGAGDFGGEGSLAGEGRADDCGTAVVISQQCVAGFVRPGWGEMPRGADVIGFAQQVEAEEERIDADIEQRAAAEPKIVKAAGRLKGGEETKIRADIF